MNKSESESESQTQHKMGMGKNNIMSMGNNVKTTHELKNLNITSNGIMLTSMGMGMGKK